MATPQNPLDVYTTYTYHFELHASSSWDELLEVAGGSAVSNLKTTRKASNGTLLINTRMDAHTVIDNVNFTFVNALGGGFSPLTPAGDLSMTVTEPGGMFFMEKLRNHAVRYQVSDFGSGLIFALKVIFVGQKPDGSITTHSDTNLIAMQMTGAAAHFDQRGGEYQLQFGISPTILSGQHELADIVGRSNKNMSIKAETIQEAGRELEAKLNAHYEEVYSKEVDNCASSRPIVYKIVIDPKIDGKLTVNSGKQLTFNPKMTILEMVQKIIMSSKEFLDVIGEGAGGAKKEFHPKVKLPVFYPKYYPRSDTIQVEIEVKLYEGSEKPNEDNTYIFDYFFNTGHKNVDILDFDVKFTNLHGWLQASTQYGTQVNSNMDGQVIKDPDWKRFVADNVVHEDSTRKRLENLKIEKHCIGARQGDGAFLPVDTKLDNTGVLNLTHEATASARLAFNVVSKAVSAVEPQLSFMIRGHLGLFNSSMLYPDSTSPIGPSLSNVFWVKVNIFDVEGQPFYYTGYYTVLSVQNIFNNGKFTQLMTVTMNDQNLDENPVVAEYDQDQGQSL